MSCSQREKLRDLERQSFSSSFREFVFALGRAQTYDISRNNYVLFGFLWGLPVPIFSVLLDILVSGRDLGLPEFWNTFALRPTHLLFALHPFLFAVVFGAMGTIRYRKDAQIKGLLSQLELNVEELNRANDQLKQLDRMKRDFIANVTHELKTPLISIQGYNEAIAEGRFGTVNDKQREGLHTALRNVDRLTALINELLEMSRIDSGKMVLNRMAFNIETAVALTMKSFEPQLRGKQIRYELESPGGVYHVWADPDRIGRVLTNLLSNAIKFTPAGGRIGVVLQPSPNGMLSLSVRDTGCGIPAHLQSHLFERFWQADSSARKGYPGTGLGLAIVKGILEIHKAPLRVESAEGKGTRVTFELPLAEKNQNFSLIPKQDRVSNEEVTL